MLKDVTGTSVWSDESPLHSTRHKSRHQLPQTSESRQTDVSDSFTVVSSIDSLQHDGQISASLQPQVSDGEPVEDDASTEDVQDLNAAFSSDGEEFSEDSILQDLRQRRAAYLTMLHQLDEAILTHS